MERTFSVCALVLILTLGADLLVRGADSFWGRFFLFLVTGF